MSAARKPLAATSRVSLAGGALLLLEPSHAVPLVSLVVAFRSGSSADPQGKDGLARLAMRMLRRGCQGMTAEQVDFRIDVLGAEMAVDTSASTVAIHAQVISRNLDAFVELLARLMSTPTFPEDELQRLKRETVAEIVESRDSDRVVAQKAFQRALFPGHPYGRNAGGTTHTVETISRDDVLAFTRRYVVQGNAVVGLAGDVTPEQATQVAGKLVASLAPGAAATDEVQEPAMRPGPPLAGGRQAGPHADADPRGDARHLAARSRPRAPGGRQRRLRRHLHVATDARGPLQARLVLRRERAHCHRPAPAGLDRCGPSPRPRTRRRA